jgi:hypothetical protein
MDPRLLPAGMTKKECGGMLKKKCAEDTGLEGSRPVNKTKILVIPDVLYRESILVFKDEYPPTIAVMTIGKVKRIASPFS